MNSLLDIRNLSVSFSSFLGRVEAVRGASLQIHPNEILALVGPSGSGKTALALALLGLNPHTTTSGQILFEEKDLLLADPAAMRKVKASSIGVVFQNPTTSLNPTMRIGKQIKERLQLAGFAATESKERALETLEQVGLSPALSSYQKYPHELSGGMCQRVMIAMAISVRPKLLIADEPTTALDVTIQVQILRLLQRLQKETSSAILLITHDLRMARRVADRIACMQKGRIERVLQP